MDYKEQLPIPNKTKVDIDSDSKPVAEMSDAEVAIECRRLAAAYLEKRGYHVVERNWRCVSGEVDIVSDDESVRVLALVKGARKLGDDADSMPELSITKEKQQLYRKFALHYLATHPDVDHVRMDVIALNIVGERCARLRHLIGAYEWEQ